MPRKRKQTPDEKERFRTGQKNEQGYTICGAKTRRGTPCKETKLFPNMRCYRHGGPTPGGVASPHYIDGRSRNSRKYSPYLPQRLTERYEVSTHDENLLEMRDELALIDSRITDIMERVDTGEAGRTWENAMTRFEQFVHASRFGNKEAQASAMNALGVALRRGQSDYAAWGEIVDLVERRRRLVESERKRMVEMQLMLSVDEGLLLTDALLMAVKNEVSDLATLSAISREFERIVNQQNLNRANRYLPANGD